MIPKRHKIGWIDDENKNFGHSDWIETGEEAERIKDALKRENPNLKVIIYPPMPEQDQKNRRRR